MDWFWQNGHGLSPVGFF